VASSKAIATADGNSTGRPNVKERKIGVMKPTVIPYFHPHIKPQSNTGICIGSIMLPIFGICPVNKGSINPNAINIADKVISLIFIFFIVNS
jgi:hypothetical protein